MEDPGVQEIVRKGEVAELVHGQVPAHAALQDHRGEREQRPDGRPRERTIEAREPHGALAG